MSSWFKELNSKSDFDDAIARKDKKYVLIYAYSGEMPWQSERGEERHAHNTDAYKVDIDKYPTAKDYFSVTTAPSVIIYQDGSEIGKEEDMDEDKAKRIGELLV